MAGVGELLASAVFKQVCGKLCSAIWKEIASQLNLSADLENLRTMLENIQTVLRKAEKRSMKDGGVCIWMKELKTAAYDMEDMLMDLEYQISPGNCGSPPNTKEVSIPPKLRITVPGKLKAMKKRLEDIARLRENDFTADTRSGEQDVIQTQTTSPTIGEDIVGRIEDKREMMELLKEDCKHSIIPIYGFGGLGKTTLAQMVFNDDKTKQDFDILAWVHVSTKFDVEKIGRSIISQVDGQSKEFDLASVQQRVNMILSGKRSLIVLDDIWEEDASKLELVRTMLKVEKPGSKIIVTTRSKQVAERMNAYLPFKLDVLPDKECWDLFKAKAFPTGTAELQMEKEMLGKQIVKKCNGVPLAVKSLGYRLRNRPLAKWEETLSSELWEEERDPTSTTTSTAVLPSLKISYYYMPDYLRPCFAYFSIFPKGFLTEKSDLIQRWIALGFVATQHRAEDRAEEYLQELIGMSFLHAASASTSISARYSKPHDELFHNELFHMHDLVHELARSVAGEEVAIFDVSRGGSSHPKMDNCRYMLFSNLNGAAPECNGMPSKARAIHFKDCTGCKPSPDIFSKSKLLRVLDFMGMQSVELPKSIGSLRHVQVLNLSENTSLTSLGGSICNFQKLHYLDLHGCLNLIDLTELHKLKGLIHLNLSECTSLKVLPRLFGELQNLSFLNLSSCSKLEELPGSFSHLTNLEHLNLSFCCQLKLSSVSFECMKSLLYLNLSGCSSLEALPEFCGENAGCLKLQILDLSNCAELAILPESCARLHKLRCLNLSGCSRIQNILHFLSKFVNLEYLNLTGVLMEKNLSRVGTRNNSDAPGTSTGDGSDDPSEELQPKTLHGILKSMFRLEYLSVGGLTLFSEQGIDKDLLTLPDFIVSTRGTGDCSNIGLLQSILDSTHCELNIRCLEIVKSPEEAKKVELGKRHQLGSLSLEWSSSEWYTPSEPTVKTMAVLENLKPHPDLQRLSIKGYNHTAFPLWIRGINDTIPNLLRLVLSDLVLCDHLPPLGYLPNLEELEICNMPQLKEVCLAPCRNLKRLSLTTLESGVGLIFHRDERGKALGTDVQEMELGHAEERQIQTISEVQSSDSSEGKGKGKESVMDKAVLWLKSWVNYMDKAVLWLKSWVNYYSKKVEKATPIPVPDVPEQFPSPFEAKAALPMLHYLKIQYCKNVTFYPGFPECEYFIDESIVSEACVRNCLTRPHAKDFIEVEELVIDGCKMFAPHFNASIPLARKLKITDYSGVDPTMWLNIRLQELEIDYRWAIANFDLLLRTAPNLEKLTLSSCDDVASGEYIFHISHISYIKINKVICFRVKPVHQHESCSSSNFLLLRQNHDFAINKLFIGNLDNVKSPEEVGHGELAGYGQLHSLSLAWSRQDSSRADDTAVLQGLQPPSNLKELSIEGYQGTIFCSWMTNISSLLPYLVTIELAYMAKCERLPSLGQLAHLEVLHISFMPSIKKVDSSYYGGRYPFRRLRELTLCAMENLDEWSTSLDDEQQQGYEIFPNLKSLVIRNCPRLRFNPYFPGSATCIIEACSELMLSKFIEGSIEALRIMEIINCGISSNSLKFLQDSVNLVRLNISNCSDLTVLPETIRGCRSLKELEILECWNFSELPEWLGELTSLTSLTIHAAKLESLPQSIRCLTALEILDLKMCNYKIRERSLSGEDKDKIKHVQHVYIREEGPSIFNLSNGIPNISILSNGISLLQKISSLQLTELSIEDLQALRPDEAEKLELVEKEQLLSLSLGWDCSAHERENDKAVLEKLQCHHTLERFCMMNYAGYDFPPRWMSSLPNLTMIELSGLLNGYLNLDHLRNLEELHVSSFYLSKRREQVSDLEICKIFSKSSIRIWSAKPLKKLRRIVISIVGKLEWETPTSLSEDIFPSLEDLEINCCQRSRFKPYIPRSARYIISGRKQQPWLRSFPSFDRVMGSATSASSSKMEIKYIGDPSSYSWESLEQLNIAELTVDYCTAKSPLPGCIRDWKSLRKLEILNCENIKTLPDWLADITSLVELKLETYWMKVLPPSVLQLTALRTLILSQCTGKFEQRYCESGEDRIKINHIEDIQIYRRATT